MPTLTISPEFFVNERKRLYSNWQRDFWREFIQNSVDAGATQINIVIAQQNDAADGCVVFITDNGCGMTKDTLTDIYFSLGKTTKGEGGVGGFGRARILTCFSHSYFRIWTKNNFVSGSGSSYEINDNDFVPGTQVEVGVTDATAASMSQALQTFLSYCQLTGITITVNHQSFRNWLYRRNKVRDLSFGSVHANKSGEYKGTVFFRVNGQFMFSRFTEAKSQVIVEIDPAKSRQVLSASRNGLMEAYQKEIDTFLAELSVDTTSAVRQRVDNSRIIKNKKGWLRNEKKQNKTGSGEKQESIAAQFVSHGLSIVSAKEFNPDGLSISQSVVAGITINTKVPDKSFDLVGTGGEGEIPIIDSLFNVCIIDETNDASFARIIEQYDPQNWVHKRQWVKGHGYRCYRKGAEFLKLLLAWKICCEAAIEALLELNGGTILWSVGWIFSYDAKGLHKRVEDAHIYAIRPIDMATRKLDWKLDKAGVIQLSSIASHEVAHTVASRHDEDYANVLTNIHGLVDQSAIWRRIREEVKGL